MSMSAHFRTHHYKWAIPVLIELQMNSGCKHITLLKSLAVSRDALSRTLEDLIESGLVQRNTGYGHPLRPEYVLTQAGREAAKNLDDLYSSLKKLDLVEVILGSKWAIPIINCLDVKKGFNEIKSQVGATARSIALILKELTQAKIVERILIDGNPPRVSYELSKIGESLRKRI